jgi:hypothetical protein
MRPATPVLLLLFLFLPLPLPPDATAGEMLNDPNGYRGIRWGAKLAEAADLTLVETVERLSEFDLKGGTPPLGEAKVETMRFIAIDEQFARVIIRYTGKGTHDKVLAYLQTQYGPLDRTPGSMMRGLSQQFNWRGDNTEVNLLYESARDRGFVFIESRILAGKFNEGINEHGY